MAKIFTVAHTQDLTMLVATFLYRLRENRDDWLELPAEPSHGPES